MKLLVPLHAVAHGRAGDKGNHSNISVIPYIPEAYTFLLDQVSEKAVFEIFRHKGATFVKRYELPNFPALNFVIYNALEGGVNSSLNIDMHGKTFSFLLLGEIKVYISKKFLPLGSPYLDGD